MRLDDDVQSSGAHEAVSSGEGEVHCSHNLGNANSCATRDANPTVHQRGGPVSPASICPPRQLQVSPLVLVRLLTNKFKASLKLLSEGIYAVILNTLHCAHILGSPVL